MLKFIGQIVVVFLIIASIFFLRDDAEKFIRGVFSRVEEFSAERDIPSVRETFTFKDFSNSKDVSKPGALKVDSDSIEESDEDGAKVSVSGIIAATNKERVKAGLKGFNVDTKLNASATVKVDDMFNLQYFEHVAPNGIDITDLGKGAGYEYIIIGENLALGEFPTSESIVRAWMNSPGHRANILHDRSIDIGVSVKSGMYEGEKVWIAVQHFGLPESYCPHVDEELKTEIESARTFLDTLAEEIEVKKQEIENHSNPHGKDYNNKVDEYNSLVNEYNALVTETKKHLDLYNEQVREFNECAQK